MDNNPRRSYQLISYMSDHTRIHWQFYFVTDPKFVTAVSNGTDILFFAKCNNLKVSKFSVSNEYFYYNNKFPINKQFKSIV